MYFEVYPDIIFIINFIADFILLTLLNLVSRKKGKVGRRALAAALGSLIATISGVLPWINEIIRYLFINMAVSVIMILTAYGRLHMVTLIRQVVILYLITYSVGGFVNSIYYHTGLRLKLIKLGDSIQLSNITWRFIVVAILIVMPLSIIAIWLFRKLHNRFPDIYMVELVLEDRCIKTRGLMDTGNCLYDPIHCKPVMVVESSLMDELLTTEFKEELNKAKRYLECDGSDTQLWEAGSQQFLRLRFIPYKSIGKTGIMLGICLDKVLIHIEGEIIRNERVTVAICNNTLSTKDDYHVILHKELL